MSKLSPSLKALIKSPASRPDPVPAPAGIRRVYDELAADAGRHKLGMRPWLAISTAATVTLNSPVSLALLHSVASARADAISSASFMREVAFRSISFNGIPRTINALVALRAALPSDVVHGLDKDSRTRPSCSDDLTVQGRHLFESVYGSLTARLTRKLDDAHPDLSRYIIRHHYGALLAQSSERFPRLLTSVVAVACLRAQTGVGPQLLSHVYGLRKATLDGWLHETDGDARWLMTDDGGEWLLTSVDTVIEAFGGGGGGNFAAAIS
ncbi:hypothetical protein L249_1203 [Ophiocordyceps polyrhachis-furcata BCC 54312]|uniref:Dol-P-Man:Man(5)GlcNAc(2)-PP-Dol alpha-1,3-mannosyltransferase n=1 Tax=Ophiocordyceps polyrhachis-furcata BCC 54312 TaxID=1330021 RepID=A0A367LG20_9HYPO|nr:hypothetical protein L249_1203 [Ophiocordyceps polyrhachis-furcata BCC 54312]